MLMHYELIAIVIQKVLSQIVDKMKKDIQLTDRDQVTVYEMSLTFFVIIQQANLFVFSQYNIVELHLEYEKRIADREGNQIRSEKRKVKAEDEPWVLKCEYGKGPQKGKREELNEENYVPEMPDLRKKRTVQNKVVEYLVMKLFSKQSIFYLVDILFKDMKDDYKALEMKVEDEDEDEEEHAEEAKAEEEK